jgi:hypothetical protein
MRPITRCVVISGLLLCLPATRTIAAELQEQTRRAFDRYAEGAIETFLARIRGVGPSPGRPPSGSTRAPRDGDIVARAGEEDGIITVPDGLLHHWVGATFIDGVTLADALHVSYAYGDYHAFYRPIIASRLLGQDGDTYRALLRIREAAGGMTAVLDVTTRVQYFYPDANTAYTISTSEEIREVKDHGSAREQHLPIGRDSGYLWRAITLGRLIEHDTGVMVEMETLGLSRSFPPLLGWIIEPIARRIGRKSVELSLQEFRTAVRARTNQPGARP